MNNLRNVILPVVTVLVFAAFVQFTRIGGGVCIIAAAVATICGLVLGQRIPFALRVFITGLFLFFGYGMCLSGRAMAPGLTGYTASMALQAFSLLAALPLLSLLRLWRPRLAISLIAAALPLCFGLAFLTAHIEERLFVQRYHDTGVGPTARWTDSNSWLSYDAQTHRLDGSD